MKISEFRKILEQLDECDAVIKSINLHGVVCLSSDGKSLAASSEIKSCFEGGLIERRANLLYQLKAAGVQIKESV